MLDSSSVVAILLVAMVAAGPIPFAHSLSFILGANIGTCADTLVATIGRSRVAVKAGIFHLALNLVSVAIGILLIEQLADLGAASGSDTGQSIANAHVLFNVAGALLVLPFVAFASGLIERIVPERSSADPAAGADPLPVQGA